MKRKVGLLLFLLPFVTVRIAAQSAPVASNVTIVGEARPGMTVYGFYVYFDADGDNESGTTYQWYTGTSPSGGFKTPIVGANSESYKINVAAGTYLGFSVTPGAENSPSPGAEATTSTWILIDANYPPVATPQKITGTLNVNDILTGHYIYSDYEGDLEDGSVYEWTADTDSTGSFADVVGNSVSHQIGMDEQRMYFRFSVTPKAASGTPLGAKVTSFAYGKANSQPYATGVSITGPDTLGGTLNGHYIFVDDDISDHEGTSLYQWYRDSDPISGATTQSCTLTIDDVGKYITFKVTPVTAGTGYPNTGDTFPSNSVGPVEDPSNPMPVATDLCIDGKRSEGERLIGQYKYSNSYDESGSKYFWYRGTTLLKSGTGYSNRRYTLQSGDINSEITFTVQPRNNLGQVGNIATSQTLAIFDMPQDEFSEANKGEQLKAIPMGGIFDGPGVTNGYFYPAIVGVAGSPATLSYTLNIKVDTSYTCNQTATKTVKIKPVVVVFEGIDTIYCDNHKGDTVYVLSVPAGALNKKFSITDPDANLTQLSGDTACVFNPDLMKTGQKVDTLYYTYIDGTTPVTIKRALVIEHIIEITLLNLDPGDEICGNTAPYELYPSLTGGKFTGPFTENLFDPGLVTGRRDTCVIYTYTSPKGCIQTVKVPVIINPAAIVAFSPADVCINDDNDSTRLVNETVSADSVSTWLWEFVETGSSISSHSYEPAYLYKSGGYHKIILTATTSKECTSSIEKTIDLGVKPQADFSWKNECWHRDGLLTNDSLIFIDRTISTSLIISRSWDFGDGNPPQTRTNPRYYKDTTRYLPVTYIVRTAYKDCHDTVSRNVFIRPTISLSELDDGYFQDFEKGKSGWVRDELDTLNNWSFGIPDRIVINKAASGDSTWYTAYDLENHKAESSSIISPCFDFTNIERPMIRLKMWKRFDNNRDGAALQYKIGDSDTWENVGTIDDGIKWYNSTLIKGRPGGQQIGWTYMTPTDTAKWTVSAHKLDGISDEKDVKFRIAYGSDGTARNDDGIAFDDIWIGRRIRNVLLEHFENIPDENSTDPTRLVNIIAGHNKQDVINIQYHTNFPDDDPFYDDNPGGASARILFYGLTRSPYSFVDGGYDRKLYANLFDYVVADIDSNDVTRRSLIDPAFAIVLDDSVTGGILTVKARIEALRTIDSAENVTLYIAVTEKENDEHEGANDVTTYYNIFRKFIPDAGGISLKKTWAKGESKTISNLSWLISKIKTSANIEVIAFIQNNITKELYQAASQIKLNVGVGIEELLQGNGNNFALYPNPAVDNLTIALENETVKGAEVKICNFQGVVISTYKIGAGVSEYVVDNLNLRQGLYLVRITAGGTDLGFKKLVVSGH